MSNNSNRFLRHLSRKRKEREDANSVDAHKGSRNVTTKPKLEQEKEAVNGSSNQLLAGYLAHEFLSRGTILGRAWDEARSETVVETKHTKSYEDVAKLLKHEGVHIPGIVNPTQLAQWLEM